MRKTLNKLTIKELNAKAAKQEFADHLAVKAHLTRRAELVKVSLPKLKFMEKENG